MIAPKCMISEGGGAGAQPPRMSVLRGDGATGVGIEHAPRDELLGEYRRRHVVDDGEGPQVVGADGEHLAVVVPALALDRGGVAGQGTGLLRGYGLQPFEVEHELR